MGNNDPDELQSDFLFARPSFIEGIGRMVDVSGSYNVYNESRNGAQADARAIRQDWRALRHDFRVAFEQLRRDIQR